jgi:hypothetical protein
VIGELLIAVLLLAVAVSSLAALMYSVSHRPAAHNEVECVAKSVARSGKCVARSVGGGPATLLRSGCATQAGFVSSGSTGCNESAADESSSETIIKPRTDSASMAMLPKRPKPSRTERPDRGFIR